MKISVSLSLIVLSLAVSTREAAAGLVVNGGFEVNASGGATSVGQVNYSTTLQAWNVGPAQNSGQAHPFVFVVDANADSTGFPSENSPPNIKIWGPASGSNNGFTGSPSGGKFLGVDADYATALVSQTVSGLTPGTTYTLEFDWAGSQFTDQSGATTQWWEVGFGGTTQDTTHAPVASRGFSGWQHATMTFTATSTTEDLKFQAKALPFTNGGPAGLPPFLLLDGVSLTANPPIDPEPPTPSVVPEPSTALTALLGGIGLVAVGIRRRVKGLVKV